MSQFAIAAQRTRVLLVLGRVSNLPTVWSNCLAAWLLCGGGPWRSLALLCLGATLLYTGGMFLNDAFDIDFDRKYRSERPIVSGQVGLQFVWTAAVVLLVAGWFAFLPFGFSAAGFAGLLVLGIIAYNALHKKTRWAPLLMAGCRFLLYLAAGSAAHLGAGQLAIQFAFGLFCYIVGLSCFARVESSGGVVSRWPIALLFVPLVIAFPFGAGTSPEFWIPALVQPLWVLCCLFGGLQRTSRLISNGVAGLLAGIPLVDWLAVAGGLPSNFSAAFPMLFLLALVLQRVAPAT